MFSFVATCFAYCGEYEKCFQSTYANRTSLVLLGISLSAHKPKPSETQPGSEPRAQLRVEAQSPPPRDLSGLLVQSEEAFAN